MNNFQLECFNAVATTLNFTQASAALYITQPALSRTIAALEDELGVLLFERTKHSVKLTSAGLAFVSPCKKILEEIKKGKTITRLSAEGKSGAITLGIQRDAFEPFTVDLVNRFQKMYPEIRVDILPMSISELLLGLENHELDTIVANGAVRLKTAERVLLSSRQECVALPPEHPLACRSSIKMAELKDENFLVISRTASIFGYDLLIEKAKEAGFEPRIIGQYDYLPSILMMVACGKGVAVLYQDLSIYTDEHVTFVPIEDVRPFDRWLIFDSQTQNPCVRFLADIAVQASHSVNTPFNLDE